MGRVIKFSPITAGITVIYVLGATLGWYALRDAGAELGRSQTVAALYWIGAVVYFATLWATRGIAPWRLSRDTGVVVISSFAFLTVFWLYGRTGGYTIWFGQRPPRGGLTGLLPYFYFVSASVLCRVLGPLAIGRLLGRRPADFGYGFRGAFRMWWIYPVLVAIVVPAVAYASTLPAFLSKYPLCKTGLSDNTLGVGVFAAYAAAMIVFYTSAESFWRGYLLLGAHRELGRNALFLMLMPYVLGHLGKPLPETLAAMAAGLVLGGLALRHRSFWLGALCHWSVAMTMDLFAIWRRGVVWLW